MDADEIRQWECDIPGSDAYLNEVYPYIEYIDVDWYVKKKRYCSHCWNTDIRTSKKWKLYCPNICRKK